SKKKNQYFKRRHYKLEPVYIVEAKRTAIGSFGGSLKGVSAVDLATPVIKNMMETTGLQNDSIDEVMMGNVFKAGAKGNPARQVTIHSGLSDNTPALTIDKQCASGLRAITMGALEIGAGDADVIIAGGTESMSNVPYLLLDARWGKKMGDMKAVDALLYDGLHCAIENYHMGVTAENLVSDYDITREEQDTYALNRQKKALQAMETNRFKDEIVPLSIKQRKQEVEFSVDEYPTETTKEKHGSLPAAFKEDGSVTAGNSSGLKDGAATVVLASASAVEKYNLTPIGKVVSYASAAVPPSVMGIGPVPATKKALEKANLTIDDMDLVELNEAFAS